MSDPESTLPPKIESAAKSIWAWGTAHTLVVSHAAAFGAGFVLKWLL